MRGGLLPPLCSIRSQLHACSPQLTHAHAALVPPFARGSSLLSGLAFTGRGSFRALFPPRPRAGGDRISMPSTVIDLSSGEPTLLRQGAGDSSLWGLESDGAELTVDSARTALGPEYNVAAFAS